MLVNVVVTLHFFLVPYVLVKLCYIGCETMGTYLMTIDKGADEISAILALLLLGAVLSA